MRDLEDLFVYMVLQAQFTHAERTLMNYMRRIDSPNVDQTVLKKLLIKVKECEALLSSAMEPKVNSSNQFN